MNRDPQLDNLQEKDIIDILDDLVEIQCSDGNWNYSPYMLGMANGLILAKSILENKEPKYLDEPEKWLCDNKVSGHVLAVAEQNND